MTGNDKKTRRARNGLNPVAAAVLLAGVAGPAGAAQIDLGNPDLDFRWDNTVRLNAGWRTDKRDPSIANNAGADAGDYKFDRGDMINKRVDILSEADLVWKERYGARVSVAGWYDAAYSDAVAKYNPDLPGTPAAGGYTDNRYSGYAKRFFRGGAEVLDAFVFGGIDLGESTVNARLGQFSTVWGQALFSGNGVTRGQMPTDIVKQTSSPGASPKETALPLKQVLVQSQVTPTLSLAGQYFLGWKSSRLPAAGTYFSGTDTYGGPDTGNVQVVRGGNGGNFGLTARLSPESWNGRSMGLYYRKYDDKLPAWPFLTGAAAPSLRFVYPRNEQLAGVDFNGSVGPVAVGAELTLNHRVGLPSATVVGTEGARGDVVHALVNGTVLLGSTPLWPTASLAVELNYTQLRKVTENANLYKGVGVVRTGSTYACTDALDPTRAGGVNDGCITRQAWGGGISFTPQYPQLLPGFDLNVPMNLIGGFKGNSALGAVNEGAASWSVGLDTAYLSVNHLTLTYSDAFATIRSRTLATPAALAGQPVYAGGNGSYQLVDRGRVTLTYARGF